MSCPSSLFLAKDGFFDSIYLASSGSQDSIGISDEVSRSNTFLKKDETGFQESTRDKFSCKICQVDFQSLLEQREHFKCDWHRYNVKRNIAKKEAFSLEKFETILSEVENLSESVDAIEISSISGSDEESDGEASGNHGFSFKGNVKIAFYLGNEKSQTCSIFRALISGNPKEPENEEIFLERIKSLTRKSEEIVWVIILCSGGHFAGVILDARNGSVLEHKTFHRYVVRAKAGGRQSTRDSTGQAPKSAGSSLRRHNEAALEKDIQNVLKEWSLRIQSAKLIFVYAPSANQKTVFGSQESPLKRSDPRIRSIPLSIRRPTLKEAKRVANTLAEIHYFQSEEGKLVSDNLKPEKLEKDRESKKKASKDSTLIKGEAMEEEKKTENEQLKLEVSPISPPLDLHIASKNGELDKVKELLEVGWDPTIKDLRGFTPYSLALDKDTRNVFRRFMASAPEKWDWQIAGVPSGLTEEMEASQAAKKAEKDAKKKAKEKERKAEKKAKEKLLKEKAAKEAKEAEKKVAEEEARNLIRYGTRQGDKSSKKGDKNVPFSKAAPPLELVEKARNEERALRALAAERRMRAEKSTPTSEGPSTLLEPHCDYCKENLAGKIPFSRLQFKYCSTTCVQMHRLELES